jgi:WD40 repeat protein/serine/threonine protein kinase/tetratricopeptide (TPR) repeat protein
MSKSDSGPDLFNVLAHEFAERYRKGERPTVSEYAERHPALASQIQELFPALVVMEEFGSVAGQTTCPHLAATADGSIPSRLGEYRILREIGRGGMGIVYEAVQESLGRHVALKVLPAHVLASPNQLERFHREAQAAACLHHGHIVPVFGVGEHEGVHYYAMQFIQGQGLDSVLLEVKRLQDRVAGAALETTGPSRPAVSMAQGLLRDPSQAASPTDRIPQDQSGSTSAILGQTQAGYFRSIAQLGAQVADALGYAHQNGVLHRDIKPANLLLDTQGTVWITDFGLAKTEGDHLTNTGDIVGTLRYMAPERFQGLSDARSDVFSLGLTLYELATLRPAFVAADRAQLLERLLRAEPPPPRQLDDSIPRDLETIILKAMAREPGRRYRSAVELAADLRRFQAGEPIQARPVGPIERTLKWMRRRPWVAALGAAFVLAVAGLLGLWGWFTWQLGTEVRLKNEALGGAEEEKRRRGEALEAVKEEERLKGEALRQKDNQLTRAEWLLYGQRIALAQRVWLDGFPHHAQQLLDTCRLDFRSWEHDYLCTLFHKNHQTLTGHTGTVSSICFSPDGQRLVSGGGHPTDSERPGELKVWDVATGQELFSVGGHLRFVTSVCFSPDGQRIASAGADPVFAVNPGQVKVWNALTGQETFSFRGAIRRVECVCFSPDGKRVLCSSEGMVKVSDVTTGRELATLRGQSWVKSMCFSPDGKRLATASDDGTVKLRDAATFQEALTFRGHTSFVHCVSFSPDGKQLVSCAGDGQNYGKIGEVKMWNALTGQETLSFKVTTGVVWSVCFSPDGKRFAGASSDKMVHVWDATTGLETLCLRGHSDTVVSVCFSPDGSQLASAGSDRTIRVWDVTTSQEAMCLKNHDGNASTVWFSRDGKHVATPCTDWTVKVWDAASGQEIRSSQLPVPEKTDSSRSSACISPDGLKMASGFVSGTIMVADLITGQVVCQHKGHAEAVWDICFSPDGTRLASASADSLVKIWDTTTGQETLCLKGGVGSLSSVAFSSDGKRLAAGSEDGVVKVWDVTSGQVILSLKAHAREVRCVCFSPDDRQLASACPGVGETVKVWDVATGQQALMLQGNAGGVWCVCFSPDGKRLASGNFDGQIIVWNAATGQETLSLRGHGRMVRSVRFSPDGNRLASGGGDNTVRVWDATLQQETRWIRGHGTRVSSVCFSPDGRRLASASDDFTVKVWDTTTLQEALSLCGHTAAVNSVCYSPDGKWLASASNDRTVKVWDATSGQQRATLQGHATEVRSVGFSPDGSRLAANDNRTVKVWDATTGQELASLPGVGGGVCFSPDGNRLTIGGKVWDAWTGQEVLALRGHGFGVMCACFSPDGTRLATASGQLVQVWDARTGKEQLSFKGHEDTVASVCFSPDGKRLASASFDRTVKLWDATLAREPVLVQQHADGVYSVCFSSDGRWLASASNEGTLQISPAPQDVGLALAARRQSLAVRQEAHTKASLAWHREEAASSEQAGQWFAAGFHLGCLLKSAPNDGALYLRRGLALARSGDPAAAQQDLARAEERNVSAAEAHQPLGAAYAERSQWEQAAAALGRAVADPRASSLAWTQHAILCLHRGDRDGYHKACAGILERFRNSTNPVDSFRICWVWSLAPQARDDLAGPIGLAEKEVARAPTSFVWRNSLGALLLRQGKPEAALIHLEEALKLHGTGGLVETRLFLARAHHQLGHAAEAKQWLEKAPRFVPEMPWEPRLRHALLRAEVENASNGPKPPGPADPPQPKKDNP